MAKRSLALLALIPLILVSGYFLSSWQKSSPTTPQPLPQSSAVGTGLLGGRYHEVSISLPKLDKPVPATYRLWIPDKVQTLRGLIVRQHGCGDSVAATGLDHANDLQWQALALKHQFGLLGIKHANAYPLCTDESIRNRVAEQAFLNTLATLAKESNHPELNQVPWILWGHSGGADWAMQMLRHHTERVIAVINVKSGGILDGSNKSEILDLEPRSVTPMLNVPVLWIIGGKDPYVEECIDLPKTIFSKFRSADAIWTIAIAPNTKHETGGSRSLAIPYLDAIVPLRLMPFGVQLRPVNQPQAWFGNPKTFEIASRTQYSENPLQAAWLPNKEFAHQWQEFMKTDQVAPTSKPAAPFAIKAKRTGATNVLVTWKYIPTLRDGLPSFRIYRDRSLIRTFQGQTHNFGDAPEPANVVLEFQDQEAPQNSTYTVSAFNAVGESVSSPTAIEP